MSMKIKYIAIIVIGTILIWFNTSLAVNFKSAFNAKEAKAWTDEFLKKTKIKYISKFNRRNIKSNEILVPLDLEYDRLAPYGLSKLFNLSGQIIKISFIYTKCQDTNEFNDYVLNTRTITHLQVAFPELFKDNSITWDRIVQVGCKNNKQGSKFFYGFVVLISPAFIPIFANSFIKVILPKKYIFDFDPKKKQILDGECTRLQVPANAFQYANGRRVKGNVALQLTEMTDKSDFINAPMPLTYSAAGKDYYFKSAGMIHLAAMGGGQNLQLRPGAQIKVELCDLSFGEPGFKLYDFKNNSWQLSPGQPKLQPSSKKDKCGKISNKDFGPDGEGQQSCLPPAVFAFLTTNIGWINLDLPKESIACLKGNIITALSSDNLEVMTIGLSYKGRFSRLLKGKNFQITAQKGERVKVLILDHKNKLIGLSNSIRVTTKSGHFKDKEGPANFMQDIGIIALKKVDDDILESKSKLKAYLQLY